MITLQNFHVGTKAIFKACKVPQRTPDFTSPSGSKYWYGSNTKGTYVIRSSDHWSVGFSKGYKHRFIEEIQTHEDGCGRISLCYWIFFLPKHENPLPCDIEMKTMTGKCYLNGFSKNKFM